MYTLRIMKQLKGPNDRFGCTTENFNLGDDYTVYGKDTDVFEEALEGGSDDFKKNLKMVVRGQTGVLFLITKDDTEDERTMYFIVSDNGKTFEKLYPSKFLE